VNSKGDIRLRVTLQYDGSRFYGWQSQPDVPTVQGEVERTVLRLTGSRRAVLGSGRTDRGVHATGQVASLTVPASWTAPKFQQALNAILPGDIWASAVTQVPDAFHPRYDATERTYLYRVATAAGARSPFLSRFCWRVPGPLDADLLGSTARLLPGSHSFLRFARSGQPERGDRCTITRSGWRRWDLGHEFLITADRYLHHMVRYLVGTMVEVARGRRPVADFEALLECEDGLVTSPPAKASGLFLAYVRYPGEPAWDAQSATPPFTTSLGAT